MPSMYGRPVPLTRFLLWVCSWVRSNDMPNLLLPRCDVTQGLSKELDTVRLLVERLTSEGRGVIEQHGSLDYVA